MTIGTENRKGNPWVLFGHDLRAVGYFWLDGWRDLTASRWLSWLAPPVQVCLVDASVGIQPCARGLPVGGVLEEMPDDVKHVAVLLPDEMVLHRSLVLPRASRAELMQTVEMEVEASSPFPPDDTLWGVRLESVHGEKIRVSFAIVARSQALRYVDEQSRWLEGVEPEVWVRASRDEPTIVIEGFGERARIRAERRKQAGGLGLLAFTILMFLLAVSVPVLQSYLVAKDARAQMHAVMEEARPLMAARDQLTSASELIDEAREHVAGYPEAVLIVELLSDVLPDSVYLDRLDIGSDRVQITGFADNAARLIQLLGEQPGFEDVRAPSAITRDRRTNLERFVISFTLKGA